MLPPKKTFAAALAALALAHAAWADGLLLVCNKGEQSLGIIDPEKGRQIAVIQENAATGHEVAASSDGALAFVPIYGSGSVGGPGTDGRLIRVIDMARREIVNTIDLGAGVRPHCAVIGPRNHHLYVTTELSNCVTEIDPKALTIIGTVPTGQAQSHMLCLSSDGERGYTANVGPGTVSVLDLTARKTITVIPIARQVQRISISRDDHWVFTGDQAQPRLAVIDTSKNQVTGYVALPAKAYGTASTPDGHWLIAALPSASQLAVIDIKTLTVAQTIDVPRSPQEVLVRPDGAVAYVSCDASHEIAVINTTTWKADQLINAGKGADGIAWVK